jgi:hypothetical protein
MIPRKHANLLSLSFGGVEDLRAALGELPARASRSQ